MSSTVIKRRTRAAVSYCLIAMVLVLGACSSKTNTGVDSALGTSSGVALTSSTGVSTMLQGESLVLTATVTNDTKNAGVTWVLDGDGSLSGVTTASATYNAPASITGTSTPIITAISITDGTQSATATLVVSGAPEISAIPLFPANSGTPYGAAVAVNGGQAPFAWSLTSGAFPTGVTEAGSTTGVESISGTPTDLGSFPFQLTVTDAASRTASVNLTLVVNPAAACLLGGQYVLLTTGVSGGALAMRAAGITIDTGGNLTGVSDRKLSASTNVADTVGGTCVNRTGNSGQLLLTGPNESPNYNFAVNTSLLEGRLQLTNGGDVGSASGLFYQQTPAAFSLTQLAGSFAFGLLGADSAERRFGLVGQLTVNASGVVTAGRADSNSGTALSAAALTGTMSAPDGNGRGTLSLAGGGQSFTLAYYVVNSNRLVLVSTDGATSAARLAGFMTRRAASFSNSDMIGPGVLSLWGAASGSQPTAVLSVGRLSNGNAASGTIDLVLDTANRDKVLLGQAATGAAYTVESDGRVTVNASVAGTARSFTLYLDASADGYVIERGSAVGSSGLLEAQVAGPYPRDLPGLFVSGTQFPQSLAPLALIPINYIASSSISSNSGSAFAAIDTTSGRGLGSISTTGITATTMAYYEVRPTKVVILRYGNSSQNPTIEWLVN